VVLGWELRTAQQKEKESNLEFCLLFFVFSLEAGTGPGALLLEVML
jgi:hypothetical protein